MKAFNLILAMSLCGSGAVGYGQTQSAPQGQAPQTTQPAPVVKSRGKSTVGEYGTGAGDAGKGAAGGAGNAAKGAGDYATLHPVKGTEAVGKGGKDVVVGAGKGTGKVIKGTGKVLTHPF